MADLSKALPYVLGNEGGFVDNPADRGGPTNMGITIMTLRGYLGSYVTRDDVKNLTLTTATQIYRRLYWEPCGLDGIEDQGVATAIFDACVNMGGRVGVLLAQDAAGVKMDGVMGRESVAAINAMSPHEFLGFFMNLVIDRYQNIAIHNPEDVQFLAGWIARARRMISLVA